MNEVTIDGTVQPNPQMETQCLDLVNQFTKSLGFFIIGRDTSINDPVSTSSSLHNKTTTVPSSSPAATTITKSAVAVIKERLHNGNYGVSMLTNNNALSPPIQSTTSLMDVCLHRDDFDTVGGAIISVPALDLQSSDQDADDRGKTARSAGASAVLPSLGKSSKVGGNDFNTNSDNSNKPVIPAMVASVLGQGTNNQMKLFLEQQQQQQQQQNKGKNTVVSDKSSLSSSPSSPSPSPSLSSKESDLLQTAAAAATDMEYAAAQNFGRPISYTRSSAPQAPGAMARVLFDSFSSLIESRIKTWTLRLLRHSLSSGDEDSRVQLMSLLATKSIELYAIATDFKIIGSRNEKDSLMKATTTTTTNTGSSPFSRNGCDFLIPLLFDVHVDIKLHGKINSLHFQTDGTAAASFHKESNKLTYFDCKIDANSLVSDMIAQARLVVLKTVAQATVTNIASPPTSISMEQSLSQFGSSLNLSNNLTAANYEVVSSNHNHHNHTNHNHAPNQDIPMRSSSHLLQTNNSSSLLRKQSSSQSSLLKSGKKRDRDRSVTWDESVNDLQKSHSVFKKPKRMGSSLKRSIKSFGKPDSDHFQSAKNATFAEFGHLTQNPNFSKLSQTRNDPNDVPVKTHHLSTMNLGARHSLSRNFAGGGNSNFDGGGNDKNMNASFDSKPLMSTTRTARTPPPSLISSHSLLRKPTFTELARNAKYSQPKPMAQNSLLPLQTLMNPGEKSSKDMKRTPTMLENILLKKTQQPKSSGGGGNADWGL